MNANTLAKKVQKLLAVRQELDRLTVLCRRHDPDACPYTAEVVNGRTVVSHRHTTTGRRYAVYAITADGALTCVTHRRPARTTVGRQIRLLERQVAEARDRGCVEWAERERLDATVRRYARTGGYRACFACLVADTRAGWTARFRTPRSAKGKRELADLTRRLAAVKATMATV